VVVNSFGGYPRKGQRLALLVAALFTLAAGRGYGEEKPEGEEASGDWEMPEIISNFDPHAQFSPWELFGSMGLRTDALMSSNDPSISSHVLFTRAELGRGGAGYFFEPYIARWRSDFRTGLAMSKTLTYDPTQDGEFAHMSAPDLQSNVELGVFPQSRFPMSMYFNRFDSANSEGGSKGGGSARVSQKVGLKQDYQNDGNTMSATFQGEHRNDNMGERGGAKLVTLMIPALANSEGSNVNNTVTLRTEKRFTEHSLSLMIRHSDDVRTTGRTFSNGRDNGIVVTHNYTPKENLNANNLITLGTMENRFHTAASGFVGENEQKEKATNSLQQFSSNVFWRDLEKPVSATAALRIAQDVETSALEMSGSSLDMERNRKNINSRLGGVFSFDGKNSLTGFVTGNFDIVEQQSALLPSEESSVGSTAQTLAHQYDAEPSDWGSMEHRWSSSASLSNAAADLMKPSQSFSERLGHGLRRKLERSGETKGKGTVRVTLDESVGFTQSMPEPESGVDLTHGAGVGYDIDSDNSPTLVDLRLTDTRTLVPDQNDGQLANFQLSRSGLKGESDRWQGNLTLNWSRTNDGEGIVTLSQTGAVNLSFSQSNLFGFENLHNDLATTLTSSAMTTLDSQPISHELSIQNTLTYRIGKLSTRLGTEIVITGDDEGITNTLGLITLEVTREFHRRF